MLPGKGAMKNEKKICAAYIRVSTDDQLEYSPESQRSLLLDYAKKNNMVLPEEYIFTDDGISGRRAERRPGFLRMISTAKQKPAPFSVILVWKFSRFARNQEESIVYKSMLRKNCGVEVVSISEQLPPGEFSSLIERVIEWMDEYYSVRLSGEVVRGMTERVRQGGAVSTPPIGYVYKDKKLVAEESEAETVRMVYRWFLAGESMLSIAHRLNAMGVKTKRGNTWENRTVRYVLTNPVYIGKVRWSPEGMNDYHKTDGWSNSTLLVDGTHEAIIGAEDFEAAQELLAANVARCRGTADRIARREDGKYMLQGVVKCSACGGTLSRTNHNGMNCVRYVHGKCSVSHHITAERLEALVLLGIEHDMSGMAFEIIPRTPVAASAGERSALEQQLHREEAILRRCKEAYAAGIDTIEEYRENKTAALRRMERIRKAMESIVPPQPADKRAFAQKQRAILRQLRDDKTSSAEKSRLLRTFVDHVVYHKSTQTISIVYYY